jgi:hypothetical protein
MDAIDVALRRIRGWFIVWFAIQSVAGLAAAVYVVEWLRHAPVIRRAMQGTTPDVTLIAGIAVVALLLGLALLVLEALSHRRPWARLVMLVIAWITAVGAGIDLLTIPGAAALLGSRLDLAAGQWSLLQATTMVTKSVDLVFWSWVIYTLQARQDVRDAFIPLRRMDDSESDGR